MSKSLIRDIMDNPEKYDYRLREIVVGAMRTHLDKQLERNVAKYFPTSQNEPIQNAETEKFQSPFNTKRYIDQTLDNLYNEKDEILSERNRLEEMINYGKEEEQC